MIKGTNQKILLWIAAILFNCFVLVWLILTSATIDLPIIASISLVCLTLFLIRYINRTNQRIAYFFQSIYNEDTAFAVLKKPTNRFEKELYESINQVSKKIESIRIKAQEQELKFQAVVEQSNTGLIAIDDSGIVQVANSAALKLLQCEVLTHVKQLKRINETLYNQVLSIRNDETKTINIINNKTQRILSLRASSLKLTNNNLKLLSISDIKPELDARETDSWIKLTRVLTHEIMNGIAPVTSVVKTVSSYFWKQNEVIKPEQINLELIQKTIKGLDVIHQQSIGLTKFVEHFRQFSKIPQPIVKEIDPYEFIERIKLSSNDIIRNSIINLIAEVRDNNFKLLGDENLLMQVIIILMTNSVDALAEVEKGTINIAFYNESNKNIIEVKDNGSGISIEVLDEIFTPFFSTKQNGTGIGLSIARQIVHLHGGSIAVSSSLGGGSVFKIML